MYNFFLDKHDIVQLTGERFYKRGLDYYHKGRVQELSYNAAINSWRGTVKGTETHHVRIFFFDDDNLEGNCGCPAYAAHYTCKHIAATLLAVSQESWKQWRNKNAGKQAVEEQDYSTSSNISKVKNPIASTPSGVGKSKQYVKLSYTLNCFQYSHNSKQLLEVELKAGISQGYIIKNIREFLLSVKKGQEYKQASPSFTYSPNQHTFLKEDEELLELLMTIQETETFNEAAAVDPLPNKKAIILPVRHIDNILPKLANNDSSVQIDQKNVHPSFRVAASRPPITFKITKRQTDRFELDISDLTEHVYFEGYGYLFASGIFYQLNSEQRKAMDKLHVLLSHRGNQKYFIKSGGMGAFISDVVPLLEKIGKVIYATNVKEHVSLTPLEAKAYIDELEGTLQLKLEFRYGEHTVHPYQNDRDTAVAIRRETAKELELLNLLESAGFVYLNKKYQLFRNEAIYQFLKNTLPILQQKADVKITDDVEAMISIRETPLKTRVEANEKNGMLEISFDIDGIIASDIKNILQALLEKKRYYRTSNGALLSLEGKTFAAFQQLASQLNISKATLNHAKLQLPLARSFQVEESLGHGEVTYGEKFQQLTKQLTKPRHVPIELPKGLKTILRDYQQTGFRWMKTLGHYRLGGILADDMGLGKTIQTITYLLSEKEVSPEPVQHLVVAPASLLYNWKKELETFAPDMQTAVIAGTKEQRKNLIQSSYGVDVFITSYPLLRKDELLYQDFLFDTLVLDEAQAVKNHLTQTAKATRSIQAKKRFALSGTPIENSLEELWGLFQTVSPGLFDNKKTFLSLDHDYISRITRPFLLRRVKTEVLQELPEKLETIKYSELTKKQKEVYLAYLEKMKSQLANTVKEKGFEKGKLEILAGLTRLRQICCHPSLFLADYNGQSGKLEQLLELVKELKTNGNRALVFSQFSNMLRIIDKKLNEAGIETFYLDGSTPVKERMKMVERFNAGEKGLFLISLKAGGTGLNLTGADTVILYDLWWNPAIEEQAAGRAHRIGQERVVQVIRLISKGTIEEKIFDLQQRKRELVNTIIKPGETMLSKLSERELQEILTL